MERFNFDSIFTGDDEKIQHKAHHFFLGVEALTKDAEKAYAAALLGVEGGAAQRRLSEIEACEDALKAFLADPRTKELEQKVTRAKLNEQGARLSDLIMKALTKQ